MNKKSQSKSSVDREHLWQLSELEKDNRFNQWLERRYRLTVNEINSHIANGVVKINKHDSISVDQMLDYYSLEQSVDDQAQNINYIPSLSNEISTRKKIYRATSMINQREHLKSVCGLILLSLGIGISYKLTRKLLDDTYSEVKRQQVFIDKGKADKYSKFNIWDSHHVRNIVFANSKDGRFSSKIWADIDSLKARIDSVLSQGLATGKSNQAMAIRLRDLVSKNVKNQTYVTERLARTESARVEFQVQKEMAKGYHYKYVKWYAEVGACRTCEDIYEDDPENIEAGVYKLADVPDIPVHPNCRCSIGYYEPEKGAKNG